MIDFDELNKLGRKANSASGEEKEKLRKEWTAELGNIATADEQEEDELQLARNKAIQKRMENRRRL